MSELSDFLRQHQRFKWTSIAEAARQLGIERSTLSKILSGKVVPGLESMLRLAVFLEEHPAKLHRLAGHAEAAELYERLFPIEGEGDALQKRFSRLRLQGLDKALESALASVEAAAERS